jgi:hypothetical protein
MYAASSRRLGKSCALPRDLCPGLTRQQLRHHSLGWAHRGLFVSICTSKATGVKNWQAMHTPGYLSFLEALVNSGGLEKAKRMTCPRKDED